MDETRFERNPVTGKLSPTHEELMRWDDWVAEHMAGFEEQYTGRYLAVWDCAIIGVGTPDEALDEAERQRPDVIPYVIYVPTEREAVFLV